MHYFCSSLRLGVKGAISLMRPDLLVDRAFFRHYARCGNWRWAALPVSVEQVHWVAVNTATGKVFCTCALRPRPCLHVQAFAQLVGRLEEDCFEVHPTLPEWLPFELSAQIRLTARRKNTDAEELRWKRARQGLEELTRWLDDVLERGIATCAAEDPHFYRLIATRLADASLRQLSRRIRTAGEAFAQHPEQPEPFLAVLADAAIALRAVERRDRLDERQQRDLEAFLGFTFKREDVRTKGERLDDTWAVVGIVQETLEADLRERRTWLWGIQSRRFALLVDYAFGVEDFAPAFPVGSLQVGTLAFYPSAWPLRALPVDTLRHLPEQAIRSLPGWRTFAEMAHTFAQAIARQPWISALPAAVEAVVPAFCGSSIGISDSSDAWLPVTEATGWVLLAMSGGLPLTIFGEWNGERFRPVSVLCDKRFVTLSHICEPSSSEAASLA